jgi:hypothetical protein
MDAQQKKATGHLNVPAANGRVSVRYRRAGRGASLAAKIEFGLPSNPRQVSKTRSELKVYEYLASPA